MNAPTSRHPILIGAAVALSAVLLIGDFLANDLWLFALVTAALAVLWLIGWRKRWATTIDLGFGGMVGLAALGVLVSAGRPTAVIFALLMLAATVSALAAWDVMRFDVRVRLFAPKTAEMPTTHDAQLEQHHLRRVLGVAGAGLAVGVFAILLRTQLTFASVALVLLLALLQFALSLRELRADA